MINAEVTSKLHHKSYKISNLSLLKGKVIKKLLFRRYVYKIRSRVKAKLLKEQRAKFCRPLKILDTLTFKDLDVTDPFEVALDKIYCRTLSNYPNFFQLFPNKDQVKR